MELSILPGSDDDQSCATFVFNGEGHTLGNVLRYILTKQCVLSVQPMYEPQCPRV